MQERRRLGERRAVVSHNAFVNHLSFYGAIAEWYGESAQQIFAHACSIIGKPIAHINEQLDCQLALEGVTVTMKQLKTDVPAPGNQLRNHNKRFENRPEDMKKIRTGKQWDL